MTLEAVNPGGWDYEAPLTSDELNALQAELIKAIDGVNGGTYDLQQSVFLDGAGWIINSGFIFQADSSLQSSGFVGINGTFAINGDGSLDGLFEVEDDGQISILSGALFRVHSGGQFVSATGSIASFGGDTTFTSTSVIALQSLACSLSGILDVVSGGRIDVETGGSVHLAAGGALTMSDGAEIRPDKANDLVINYSPFIWRIHLTPQSMTYTGDTADFHPQYDAKPVWVMHQVVNQALISFAIPLKPGDVLTALSVTLKGDVNTGGPGHSAPPAVRPSITLHRLNLNGGETALVTVGDPVSTLPAYDDTHEIPITDATPGIGGFSLPYTVQASEILYLTITNERGANAEVDHCGICSIYGTGLARYYRGPNEVY